MGEAKHRDSSSGQYRLRGTSLSPREIVDQVKQLRGVLAKLRANPTKAHRVVDPSNEQVIDILDGETDHLLDQIERVALLSFTRNTRGGRS